MIKNPYGQLPFPTELAFEPIQLCNANCYCCPYSWLKDDESYRGKAMNKSQITKLLDEFGSVRKTYNYRGKLTINPFRFSDPLICPDLELIFQLAEKHDISVVITTNGAALSGERIALLNRYRNRMTKISVSFIGSTEADIKKLMGISFSKVLRNLDEIANNWPELRSLFRVSLRVINDTPEERDVIKELQQRFLNKGIGVKAINEKWMTNRIDASDFVVGQKPERLPAPEQTSESYVVGCGWSKHLLERMEVMTDGSVVLCCDDAEKHKIFGNVFENSIESIWNGSIRAEHLAILGAKFTEKKCSLICASCTRAVWNDGSVLKDDMQHRSTISDKKEKYNNNGNHFYDLRQENAALKKAVHDLAIKLREKDNIVLN